MGARKCLNSARACMGMMMIHQKQTIFFLVDNFLVVPIPLSVSLLVPLFLFLFLHSKKQKILDVPFRFIPLFRFHSSGFLCVCEWAECIVTSRFLAWARVVFSRCRILCANECTDKIQRSGEIRRVYGKRKRDIKRPKDNVCMQVCIAVCECEWISAAEQQNMENRTSDAKNQNVSFGTRMESLAKLMGRRAK